MKYRQAKPAATDAEEQQALGELKTLLEERGVVPPAGPPDAYWPNLTVRTNERISDATSGKAISISWAARVAIPGVVAIIFFFIGLHYYAPQQPSPGISLTSVVSSLPVEVLDSMLVEPQHMESSFSAAELKAGLFAASTDQLLDYLITDGKVESVLETMSDQQVNSLLVTLGSRKANL